MEQLKKHRPEVSFEVKDDGRRESTFTKLQNQEHEDETHLKTAKEMRELLEKLNAKREGRAKGAKVMTESSEVIEEAQQKTVKNSSAHIHHKTNDNEHRTRTMEFGKAQAGNVEFGTLKEEEEEATKEEADEEPSSAEVLQSVLAKLKKLGPRGRKLWEQLRKEAKLSEEEGEKDQNVNNNSTETQTEEPSGTVGPVGNDRIASILRKRRDLIMKTALSVELNSDDETENLAKEQGFVPDGHADHHHILNETTANDRSDSEIWSSFSSSEEALLECPGLIMSLPLTPSRSCERRKDDASLREEFSPNTITFT